MPSALSHRRNVIITDILRNIGEMLRVSEIALGPIMDIIIRLYLAQTFLMSGILKLSNWDTALYLSAHEYPVSWMNPVAAAYSGAAIEIICPIFLLFGLMTRFAALPMLILSIVIQMNYQALNIQVFWVILLGWYVVMGAGSLSLDHAFRGIKDSAIPLASAVGKLFDFLTIYIGPLYQLFIRLWIAAVLYFASHTQMEVMSLVKVFSFLDYQYQIFIFHTDAANFFLGIISTLCALFIAIGLGTRLVALATFIAISFIIMHVTVTPIQMTEYVFWFMLLDLLFFHGPGTLSLDFLIRRWLCNHAPELEGHISQIDESLPHIVIVGAGFGGVSAARTLRTTACRITLIDKHNYHLFQPLLYQVATAGLSPADIAVPIRSLFSGQSNVRIVLGEVKSIDKKKDQVILTDGKCFNFDYLILATGAQHSYFGKDQWAAFAPGLKQIEDAIAIRGKLLKAFEAAENSDNLLEQQALLTFVIVGGGPTGVELAGALAELAHQGMINEFRNIDPTKAKIYLIEAGPRLLSVMPEELSKYTQESLEKLGVDVITNARVEDITHDSVVVGNKKINAATIFWAAGVQASAAAKWMQAEVDQAGRIKVNKDLTVPGSNNIFAIGDTALAQVWHSKPMPGLAPAAKQSGKFVAKQIRALIEGRKPKKEFVYKHYGSLATIGRKSAVADFGAFRMYGAPAWWFWGAIHLFFLNNMRNRIIVMFQWFWAYITFKRTTRLITDNRQ